MECTKFRKAAITPSFGRKAALCNPHQKKPCKNLQEWGCKAKLCTGCNPLIFYR